MVSKRVIFGAFLFLIQSIFYIFGGVLIKQLFHSRLLDMRLVVNYKPGVRSVLKRERYEVLDSS